MIPLNAHAMMRRLESAPLVLVCLFLLLVFVTTGGVAVYSLHRVSEIHQTLDSTNELLEKRIRRVETGLSFHSRRRHLTVGIRDEILRVNPEIERQEALHYAELIVRASEKYPTIDPLLFFALGVVESGFDPRATSQANARGLYQIWPATGRRLARMLSWEYTDDMLFDPVVNTEMAALYLDILFSTYNDERLVLAEYNGGPVNAGYLRAGSPLTAAETQAYVPKVLHSYRRVEGSFGRGIHDGTVSMD